MAQSDPAVSRVLAHLTADEQLDDLIFSIDYPASPRPNPLTTVLCTVGCASSGLEVRPGGWYQAETSVELIIHAPPTLGSAACTDAFCRICDRLTDTLPGVVSIQRGGISFNSTWGAFLLRCTVLMRDCRDVAHDETPLTRVVVKGVVK